MKRLFIALAAAVAVSTASAKVTDTQSFETSFSDFVPSVENVDESELVSYDNDGPGFAAPYDFDDFGLKYLKLDTGDATLWRTNASEAANVYFDMAIQFTPTAEGEEPDHNGNKILLFMDANTNLVVISGTDATDHTPVTNRYENVVEAKTWARLTLSAMQDQGSLLFRVSVNGNPINHNLFYSLDEDTTVREVGFSGSGALDDFVARTTDPFISNPVVSVGGEGYASFDEALDDAGSDVIFELNADDTSSKTLASGDSIKVKLNGNTLSFAGSPATITVGDVTTYTAAYFPRTATAGQDGTAANPYEIADVDDIVALKAAFAADATWRSKNYKLVADIDATDLGYFDGIGTASGTNGNTGLNGGTFDGAGHTISNVKFTPAKYRGFFNQVLNSTIKDLTINVVDIQQTSAAEHGYAAFAGNMKNSQILNCRATGTLGTTAKPTMHTSAGFAVKVDSAGVFVNCTNEIDIVCSLTDNPKIGGIAGLFQGGALTNCWNSGDITITCKKCNNNGNGAGGLVGYAQTSTLKIHGGGNEGTIQSTDTTPDGGTYDIKVGTIIGMQNSSMATVTGGTVAQADVAPAGAFANVSGLTYATVDNNVATFVPDAELAAGNTYVLQQNVAASGTPVYTFDAAGTIAFNTNGFNFAGTVAAGASLGVVGPVVDGSVLTYSAGVAAVDGVAYATFEDALAALEGETTDDFVTLLADVTYVLSAGETLRVKTGGHFFTPNTSADDVVVSDSTDGDIMIFTAVKCMASYNGTWYVTFDEAYSAALAAQGNATMVVRISDDFTPAISATYNHFYSLTFEDVRDDQSTGLTINLKNSAGTAYMSSSRYFFPSNATLVLAADWEPWQGSLATGGTLEIPEDVTVFVNCAANGFGYDYLSGISSIVGAGTIKIGEYTYGDGHSDLYYIVGNDKLASLTNAAWEGTVEVSGSCDWTWNLAKLGNANSTIRFNGLTTYLSSGTHPVNVELVGDGLTINGEYGSGTWTFSGDLTGTGSLNVAIKNSSGTTLKAVQFTGDVSGFSGGISFDADANAYVAFGEDTTNAKCIIVSEGSEATIGSDATWTAPGGIVVKGTLNVNGNVAATIYGVTGTGVVNSTKPTLTMTSFSSYWNGTYVIGWEGSSSTEIAFNSYGYANSKIKIPSRATLEGFVEVKAYNTLTNNAEVVVDGELNLSNGYDYSTVVWKKISGLGTVKYAFAPSHWIKEKIISLEGFSGSIEVSAKTQLEIDGVNVAREPVAGDCIVPITVAEGGTVGGDLKLYVAGTETGTLEYKADGANGAGLYVASAPTPTVPDVTPSASGTVDCGSAAAAAAAATAINEAKATYIKAPAAASLSGEAAAAYANLFDARADGNNVVVELNAAGTNALETAATNVAAQVVAPANLASILSGASALSITGVQPGFYYSVVYSADLSTLGSASEGDRAVAGSDGAVTLPIPAKSSGAKAGFYRVLVNVGPKVTE